MSIFSKKKTPRKSKAKKRPTNKRPAVRKPTGGASKSKTAKAPPIGRTLSTYDKYLPGAKTGSEKKRGVVVLDRNKRGDLAVVPLSKSDGKHRTRLPNYQDGNTRFKHFVETKDNEGAPIRVNSKFRANNQNQDVSSKDMSFVRRTVLTSSVPARENRKKIKDFHEK